MTILHGVYTAFWSLFALLCILAAAFTFWNNGKETLAEVQINTQRAQTQLLLAAICLGFIAVWRW